MTCCRIQRSTGTEGNSGTANYRSFPDFLLPQHVRARLVVCPTVDLVTSRAREVQRIRETKPSPFNRGHRNIENGLNVAPDLASFKAASLNERAVSWKKPKPESRARMVSHAKR